MIKLIIRLPFVLPITVFFCCCGLLAQGKSDFLKVYDIFYVDKSGDLTRNNDKINDGGEHFTPDILYSDGSFLSSYSEDVTNVIKGQGSFSDVRRTSTILNTFKIFFQGSVYESYYGPDNVVRDGKFIYYVRCEKKEYVNTKDGNCCVKTAIYANNTKIDEADVTSDIEASVGMSSINPLFVKNGILYYIKAVGESSNFYGYDPIRQKSFLFKPDLFTNNDNELLGILDNGDIIFSNSSGIFRNDLQSKIIGIQRLGSPFSPFVKGIAVGNNYYYFTSPVDENKPHGLIKDNLLVANIRSDTYGRTIDAGKEDCHFGNSIWGYLSVMQCVNKQGTIVRMDKKTNKPTPHRGQPPYEETDIVYFVNSDIIDFSRYWNIGTALFDKGIKNISFVFEEEGNVSFLIVTALEENKMLPDIYFMRYLGGGKISAPEMLVSEATLFGVTKKSNHQ